MKRVIVAALFVAAGLTGCGGGASTEDTLSTSTSVSGIDYTDSILTGGGYTVRAQLGDLDGASVNIKNLTTGETLWEGETKNGVFKIPDTVILEDNETYLITVSGGTDLDTNDDGFYGDSAPNHGTIHAVVTGTDIKNNNLVVSPLTTFVYENLYKYGYFDGNYGGYDTLTDALRYVGRRKLENTYGLLLPATNWVTIYDYTMTDLIYRKMADYIEDIRVNETDRIKIARDMREVRNIYSDYYKYYCIDFIPETGRIISIDEPDCEEKRQEAWGYYNKQEREIEGWSWLNSTNVTVSYISFGRTELKNVPGELRWIGFRGKDIYVLLVNDSGNGILKHFVFNESDEAEEKEDVIITAPKRFFLVSNRNRTKTAVFVETASGVEIYDSSLNLKERMDGVTVDIPGYYFIKLSNGNVYDASLNMTTDFDKYIYSDVVNPDGYVYVNGKEVIANNLTSIEGNSKKTYFGNYLFYQPGTVSGYDVGNVTMINLDYVE